jgi:hypothetical protein
VSGLALPLVPATSPTLAEVMRLCQLRAGFSKIPESYDFVLGNPKGWLGTAYHQVLEKIVGVNLGNEALEAAVERLWNEAVATQYERAQVHSLDRRFGLPTTWPGYYLVRASVLLRAQDLVAGQVAMHLNTPAAGSKQHGGAIREIREQKFTSCGGRLIGRPDVIRGGEVIDYKSGAIAEYDDDAQSEVVKAGYVRQLRIYGYLIKQTLGYWPKRGRLLPLVGAGVEVGLEPELCDKEACDAVALLDDYNSKVGARNQLTAVAQPSAQTCKWCPFKLFCPPFWQSVSLAWSGQLDGAVLEGTVHEGHSIHSGAAMSISIDVDGGSEVHQRYQIAPLDPTIQTAFPGVNAWGRVRVVSLRKRPDGSLVPSQRTVIARVSDLLPAVTLGV